MTTHQSSLRQTQANTFAEAFLQYNARLVAPTHLPHAFQALHPFASPEIARLVNTFYHKYYADHDVRVALLGINPGRFGGGITGIPFTDPIRLKEKCGIDHHLPMKPELSSQFIYEMIEQYGGVQKFYHHFFIHSLYPLALVKDGKNVNYYDDKALFDAVYADIISHIQALLQLPVCRRVVICIGEGKNFALLQKLNHTYHWWQTIIPVAHPRFIMQYRRKQKESYLHQYLQVLHQAKQVCFSKS